jgi:hypothetical protein
LSQIRLGGGLDENRQFHDFFKILALTSSQGAPARGLAS